MPPAAARRPRALRALPLLLGAATLLAAGVATPAAAATPNDGSDPRQLTVIGTRGWFNAEDGIHGREPGVTNGTAGGTHMVRDLRPGAGDSYPYPFIGLGSRAVFDTSPADSTYVPYVSNGTKTGTSPLRPVGESPDSRGRRSECRSRRK